MKKTILSLLLIGSSCMVFAQVDSTRRNNTNTYDSTRSMNNATMNGDSTGMNNMNNMNNNMNNMNRDSSMSSSGAYNAYGTTSVNIPYRAQLNVQKDYPSANNITWTRSGDWYQGTYMNNGRYSHIYYNDRGDTYTVSMPVTETYVPDDIMNKVTTMYGPMVYDVTMMKGDSGQSIYQIRTLENGQVKAQWIGDDGSTVMDPFRSDINTNMSSSSNAAMDNGNMDSSSMNNNMNNNMNATDSMNNWNNRNNTDSMNNMNNMNNMDSSRMNNGTNDMNNTMDSTMTTDSSGHNTTSGMSNKGDTKVKIKTESKNGKETKVKIKNGEVKKEE